MTIQNFTRFFDKAGNDLNLGATYTPLISLYDGSETLYESYYGKIFFPSVSVGLIESQQIYLLQEVTGPTASYELRKIQGKATVIGGNSTVTAVNSDFTSLSIGTSIKIGNYDYTVSSVSGATSMVVSPTPSASLVTFDIYLYDYLSYNQLRTSPDTFTETINAKFDEDLNFFLYNISYTEDNPVIEKSYEVDYELADGSSDSIDSLTDRIQLSSITTIPTQINLGVSSDIEEILTRNFSLSSIKTYNEVLSASPVYSTTYLFSIGGTSHPIYDISTFTVEGIGLSGSTFNVQPLTVLSVGVSGSDTIFEVEMFDETPIGSSNYSNYRISWVNNLSLAELELYGETESEDERFKTVLANFGKNIDHDKEYIFRESDINEELPDYTLLNKKRKELLLEGDNIYPYLGSYRALINIINFFGYYDVRIKEYFLNVNPSASNFGKYLHILIPRDSKQREDVRHAWSLVPSVIYKKTSLFGLFYDINRVNENVDEYGIPEVEDAFDFSPEEVLIKLFGLKELLKKEFLPLNARIYDITGEGIYFERIRIDSWADNLNYITIDLGKRPVFSILPKDYTYVSDLRRIDNFYVNKFADQGLTGFLGASASEPLITADSYVGPVSSLYGTYLESYSTYLDTIYNEDGNLTELLDDSWYYMPPGIEITNFNMIAARMHPLPDTENVVTGGPLLLEAFFDLSWEESQFNWGQLGILGPSGSPLNINIWTWQSIGRGEYVDMRWTVEKNGDQGFYYDSYRQPIENFVTTTPGATAYSIPGKITVDVSGGGIVAVNIIPGYGYTTVPSVYVTPPDTAGTTATITLTVVEGYLVLSGFTAGSGYTYSPTVTVAPPEPVLEDVQRVLHALALPYEGEYQVGLYIYDITNGYTVEFQKYNVKNRNVDFASSSRSETYQRTWEDFSIETVSYNNSLDSHLVTWQEVTGPWYYPIHVHSTWADSVVSWESLNFSSFDNADLYEYDLNTKIYSIDRIGESILLTGDITGNLQNLLKLQVGDFLFMTRNESDIIVENLKIPVDSFGNQVYGLVGVTPTIATLTGLSGDNVLETGSADTTSYLTIGDSLYLPSPVSKWFTIEGVGATYITINDTLSSSISSIGLTYDTDLEITANYTGSPVTMERYSRIILSSNCDYSTLDTSSDLYGYVDGLTATSSSITVTSDELTIRKMILENSSLTGCGNNSIYATWGIFAGTYAIEITNINVSGNNTQIRLKDSNKELYYLDGNFTVRLADYDVDYAETRIGPGALTFENSDELTWNENTSLTWYGVEYHGGVLCGYTIPFVSPNGSITIDEEPTFFFTGDSTIDSTKAGLNVAAIELSSSTNSGVSKYDYAVLPKDELYITDNAGHELEVSIAAPVGATSITLNAFPDGGRLKIPATMSLTIAGGSIDTMTIETPGFGYVYTPTVSIDHPSCSGTEATVSLVMINTPYAGSIDSLSFTGGTGYTSIPNITVEFPTGFKTGDNYIWTGYEWVEIIDVTISNELILATPLVYPVATGVFLLLPYQYHKQLFMNPLLMQQFYYFIHGRAKNPSNEMLSYVNFTNGVESEWAVYPDRTYTYPLRNSILNIDTDLTQDYLYNKWVYEGSDYPSLNIYKDYESDRLSYQSRIPYSMTLQSPYSFIDTVISDNQRVVPQFTPVVFHYDNCRIPGKNNPIWTITNEETGKIEVMTDKSKLMWNFTKTGNFTISLQIDDSNGNRSFGQKNSLIVVNGN